MLVLLGEGRGKDALAENILDALGPTLVRDGQGERV